MIVYHLMKNLNMTLADIENMIPFELTVFKTLLQNELKERADRHKELMNSRRARR